MAIKKVVELEVVIKDGKAEKKLENIGDVINEQKQITIEFEKELQKLEQQLKQTARGNIPQQKALKKRIVGLKDAVKDQRLAIKALNQERSRTKGAAAQIKASKKLNEGYFESKESLTDVNRLTAEFALKVKAVKNIMIGGAQAAGTFVKSLSGIKKALLATGIGALVVALGIVLAYWDDITDAINGTNKALEKQIKLTEETIALLDGKLDILESEQKLLKAQGLSLEENKKKQQEILETKKEELGILISNLELRLQEKELDVIKLTAWEKFTGFARIAAGLPPLAPIPKITDEEAKFVKDLRDALTQARIDLNLIKVDLIELKEGSKGERKRLSPVEAQQSEIEFLINHEQLKTDIITDGLEKRGARIAQQAEADFNAQIFWAELTLEEKLQIASNTFNSLSVILGKQTAAGKAAAIATATIDTYLAANASFSALAGIPIVGPVLGAIAAAAAITAGLANVKAIIQTKTPGPQVSGSAAPEVPQIAQAPNFNVVGASGTNQLASAIGGQFQQPIKAFVVAGDVTTAQELERNIVQSSKVG